MLTCPECSLTITDTQEECPKCRTKIEVIVETLEAEKKEEQVESADEKQATDLSAVYESSDADAKEDAEEDTDVEAVDDEKIDVEALMEEHIEDETRLCETCMTAIEDDQNFCAACGDNVNAAKEEAVPVVKIPKTDAGSNKWIAAIGYIFFFFPLVIGYFKKSKFAKFHAKQAALLFGVSIVLFVVLTMFRNWLIVTLPQGLMWYHGTGQLFYHYLAFMINLLHLLPFAFMIVGIVNALREKKRQLPVIGKLINQEVEMAEADYIIEEENADVVEENEE